MGEEVRMPVAPDVRPIRRTVELKPLVMDLIMAMEGIDVTGGDMAHALVFVLVMHQVRNGWTTEQMLQLWERYVREIEGSMGAGPVFVGEA